MTSKEKANELVGKFYCQVDSIGLLFCLNYSNAKQCSLIAVDEIIEATKGMVDKGSGYSSEEYWIEVKAEIELL